MGVITQQRGGGKLCLYEYSSLFRFPFLNLTASSTQKFFPSTDETVQAGVDSYLSSLL